MRSRASPHNCPLCGGRLSAIGTRRRHFIREDGTKAVLMIRRYRCEGCDRIHHELPDFLLPYKQHTALTFEKVCQGRRWDVCCDDNDFRRLYLWLMQIFFPMAVKLFSPSPGIGRVLLRKNISDSPPGWLSKLIYWLVNENRWQTHFAVFSGSFPVMLMLEPDERTVIGTSAGKSGKKTNS